MPAVDSVPCPRVSRILVLGAGYIGAKVAERALAAGDEVVLADNWHATRREQTDVLAEAGAEVRTADVRRLEEVEALFDPRPDRVVHLAALASRPLSWKEPLYTEQTNLTGVRHVAEAASGAGGMPIAFGSSLHVYGADLAGDVGPGTPYGAQRDLTHLSKVYAELCLRLYAERDGFDLGLLRLAVVYGPSPIEHDGPDAVTVIDKFRRLAAAGEPLPVDDPAAVLGAVHVDDAARILLEAGPGTENVCAETLTVGQVAAIARAEDPGAAPAPRWRYSSELDYEHRLLP
jgi:nucleoside-diphosphate-sugar epimerase